MFEIICILIFICFFLIDKSKKLQIKKKLKEQVQWCIVGIEDNYYRLPIFDYIWDWSNKLNIKKGYLLTVHDVPIVEEILIKYREDLTLNYMKNNLKESKQIASFSCEEYFFFSLRTFLKDHLVSRPFYDYEICGAILNGDSYATTYGLTEFGITFNKLYLLSEMVCEQSKRINKYGDFNSSNDIKKYIKTKQITLYRCG